MILVASLSAGLTLQGCGTSKEGVPFRAYQGPIQPPAQVATVVNKSAWLKAIDRKDLPKHSNPKKYYNQAKLLPGRYVLSISRSFLVSVLVDTRGIVTYERAFTAELKPGHVYSLHADRTTGRGYRVYLWIEDDATKQVVAGEKLKCSFLC